MAVRGNLFSDPKKMAAMLVYCKGAPYQFQNLNEIGLTSLVIREDEITDEIVQAIGNNCKNLKHLLLEYMQTDNITPILQNCTQITRYIN